MQTTISIITTIIILAAILILIINITIIGPERQKPKTALINYSRPGDRGQQWQVPLPCIIDQLVLPSTPPQAGVKPIFSVTRKFDPRSCP